MNSKDREDKYGAPKYGVPPKKGVGGNGFRQARKDHRSSSDAPRNTRSGASAANPREGTGVAISTFGGMYANIISGNVFRNAVWSVGPEQPAKALPVEQTMDAVQAWKVARLYTPDGRTVALGAVHHDTRHPVEGTAECHIEAGGGWGLRYLIIDDTPARTHEVPNLACQCGFYAWKTRAGASDYITEMAGWPQRWGSPYDHLSALVLMQVELFGKVIQFEHGYRAQAQRVLGITIPNVCSALLCGQPATVIDFPAIGRSVPFRVLCAAHREHASLTTVGVADVANALGCEVTWGSA